MELIKFISSIWSKKKVLFLNYNHKIKCGKEEQWKGFYSTKDIFEKYLKKYDVKFLNYEDIIVFEDNILIDGVDIENFSFVFFGFVSKNTDLFRVVKDRLEVLNIPHIMYGNTVDNDNKLNDLNLFKQKKVPHINTIISTTWSDKIKNLKLPIVIKPYNGACGRGVVKLTTYKDVKSALSTPNGLKLIQPWIDNDGDYRIITFDGKVVLHSKRVAKEGEWRNNIAQGGSVLKSDLPKNILDMASDLSKSIEKKLGNPMIIGFDVIKNKNTDEFLFMEINAGPHYFTFMEDNNIDFPKVLCEYMDKKISEKKIKWKIEFNI